MTKPKSGLNIPARKTKSYTPTSARVLVLYGYDDDKRPRGAKFYEPEFDAARKAAELMKLSVHEGETKKLRRHLSKISLGNVYASGWAAVPSVTQAQYDALVKKLTGNPAAKAGAPIPTSFPADFDSIIVGSLVLAPSDNAAADGYWAAVVTKVEGEMLHLQLKDWPSEKGKRHRNAVGLCCPPEK